ncbi:helix-turn-helix transcriptional regulator [Pseudomonas sp. MWU13-2105]|uniref:helix-turn-helix transcriptional regulator n=1 Tax=Pseudomonas sp. MWU13-2105 TaxID=2935074 RepID=UPI00200EBC40|nr:helix-turn-helix transcriptional regulator [Pseudomonas sp. MWU13-2105]
MPRIATLPTIKVIAARSQLRRYITELGISDNEYSRRCGVPQYTLSKFLNGHIKTLTPAVEKALCYANIGIIHDVTDLTQHPAIRKALGHAWDGTAQGAETLALMIEAMAPLIRASQNSTRQ